MTDVQANEKRRRRGRISNRWTSYITRLVRQFRAELIQELGGAEPCGSKRALLTLVCQQYGLLLILERRMRHERLISEDGTLISLLGKNQLAWISSFQRNLTLLTGDVAAADDFGRVLKHADA